MTNIHTTKRGSQDNCRVRAYPRPAPPSPNPYNIPHNHSQLTIGEYRFKLSSNLTGLVCIHIVSKSHLETVFQAWEIEKLYRAPYPTFLEGDLWHTPLSNDLPPIIIPLIKLELSPTYIVTDRIRYLLRSDIIHGKRNGVSTVQPFCYMMKLTRQKAIRCNFKEIVDIALRSGLSSIQKGGSSNASILREVPY